MSSETKFILGLMAGVGSLIVFMVSQSPIWHLKSAFLLGGGCALLVRSFLPMLLFGGGGSLVRRWLCSYGCSRIQNFI
jgi:hypothetical protein